MKAFSQLTRREIVIETLRWLLTSPAAVLGNYVGYIIGGVFIALAQRLQIVNAPSDDSASNRFARYVIWLFPMGVIVVVAAAKTAPRFRLVAAIVAAICWTLWTNRIHGFDGPTVYGTLAAAGCGTGIVFYLDRFGRRSP
jgi:hypothetical protein